MKNMRLRNNCKNDLVEDNKKDFKVWTKGFKNKKQYQNHNENQEKICLLAMDKTRNQTKSLRFSYFSRFVFRLYLANSLFLLSAFRPHIFTFNFDLINSFFFFFNLKVPIFILLPFVLTLSIFFLFVPYL